MKRQRPQSPLAPCSPLPLSPCPLPCGPHQSFIQPHILRRAAVPRPVGPHAGPHQAAPGVGLLAVEVDAAPHGVEQGVGLVGDEDEAGGRAGRQGLRRRVHDRVGQAARRPHHRRRAVVHAVELVQARRLVEARHQEQVGPRLDLMRQRFVEADQQADPFGKALLPGPATERDTPGRPGPARPAAPPAAAARRGLAGSVRCPFAPPAGPPRPAAAPPARPPDPSRRCSASLHAGLPGARWSAS